MLILEIKKIIKRKEFIFFWYIMFFCMILDFGINCYNMYGIQLTELYSANVMGVLENISRSSFRTVYTIFLPFVVCFVASDTYLVDKNRGINNYILTRVDKKSYIWNKAKAIFIVVSITIIINILLNSLLNCIAFPISGYRNLFEMIPASFSYQKNYNFIQKLELYYPYIHLVFSALMRGICGGIFALLAYGISFIKGMNKYIVMVAPFIIYNLIPVLGEVMERFGFPDSICDKLDGFGMMFMTRPRGDDIITFFMEIVIYFVFAIYMINLGTKREEI